MVCILMLPVLPFVLLFSPKRRSNILQRLGFQSRSTLRPKPAHQKRFWIHALSVGEVISAAPFIRRLKREYQHLDIVLTASTKTGFDTANRLFKKEAAGYFPFDIGFCIRKNLREIDPDVIVLVETDLWPNFLVETSKLKVPVVLINARLSKRSLNRYLMFKPFFRDIFSFLSYIMVQSALDETRFKMLGIKDENITVTGNIKFDQQIKGESQYRDVLPRQLISLKTLLSGHNDTQVIIAGSIHEGEETIMSRVYSRLKKKIPALFMILVPRNPDDCKRIHRYLNSSNITTSLLSDTSSADNPDVILVDTIGLLSQLYALCDIAFIGGSMVRQGGHNPLEAAAFSKPILFGNDMSDFTEISRLLTDNRGAVIVHNEEDLVHQMTKILSTPELKEWMGRQNYSVFSNNSGAVDNILRKLEPLYFV